MSRRRTIKGKDLIVDIRSGITDAELMEKHKLSAMELDTVFRHLVDSDLVSRRELEAREALSDSQITRAFVESRDGAKKLD